MRVAACRQNEATKSGLWDADAPHEIVLFPSSLGGFGNLARDVAPKVVAPRAHWQPTRMTRKGTCGPGLSADSMIVALAHAIAMIRGFLTPRPGDQRVSEVERVGRVSARIG